jgi:hypothetical protein
VHFDIQDKLAHNAAQDNCNLRLLLLQALAMPTRMLPTTNKHAAVQLTV